MQSPPASATKNPAATPLIPVPRQRACPDCKSAIMYYDKYCRRCRPDWVCPCGTHTRDTMNKCFTCGAPRAKVERDIKE